MTGIKLVESVSDVSSIMSKNGEKVLYTFWHYGEDIYMYMDARTKKLIIKHRKNEPISNELRAALTDAFHQMGKDELDAYYGQFTEEELREMRNDGIETDEPERMINMTKAITLKVDIKGKVTPFARTTRIYQDSNGALSALHFKNQYDVERVDMHEDSMVLVLKKKRPERVEDLSQLLAMDNDTFISSVSAADPVDKPIEASNKEEINVTTTNEGAITADMLKAGINATQANIKGEMTMNAIKLPSPDELTNVRTPDMTTQPVQAPQTAKKERSGHKTKEAAIAAYQATQAANATAVQGPANAGGNEKATKTAAKSTPDWIGVKPDGSRYIAVMTPNNQAMVLTETANGSGLYHVNKLVNTDGALSSEPWMLKNGAVYGMSSNDIYKAIQNKAIMPVKYTKEWAAANAERRDGAANAGRGSKQAQAAEPVIDNVTANSATVQSRAGISLKGIKLPNIDIATGVHKTYNGTIKTASAVGTLGVNLSTGVVAVTCETVKDTAEVVVAKAAGSLIELFTNNLLKFGDDVMGGVFGSRA